MRPAGCTASLILALWNLLCFVPSLLLKNKRYFLTLWSKIAALIHSVIVFHPFADGNKRTALVAADACLRLKGSRVVPSKAIESFFWAIARGEESIAEITA
jgi:death on curing protein